MEGIRARDTLSIAIKNVGERMLTASILAASPWSKLLIRVEALSSPIEHHR